MRRAGTAIYSVMDLALGATATANASATNGGSAVAQATGGTRLWGTGNRNRDFYCDAGRHRKRDRNSDGRALALSGTSLVSKRQLIRYDDQWQCGPGEVHCHWLISGGGQAQATAQTNFGNFHIGSIYVHKPR